MRSPLSLANRSHTTQLITAIGYGILCAVLYMVRIPIPGTPVPFIIQPFTSFAGSILLGGRYGLLSQLILICILPFTVWAPIGGWSLLWGPTSGYIWGFVIAGTLGRALMKPSYSRHVNAWILLLVTVGCLHVPGMLVLRSWYWFIGHSVPTWSLLFHQAITPFILGDTLKAAAAAYLYDHLHHRER
jgi:biotin transport system substrate-specific component